MEQYSGIIILPNTGRQRYDDDMIR